MYQYREKYEANTVGCSAREGSLEGEMSALYFVRSGGEVRGVVKVLRNSVQMGDVAGSLAGNAALWRRNKLGKESLAFVKKVFVAVNPKLVQEDASSFDISEDITIEKTKETFAFPNNIESIGKCTQIHHNTLGKTAFANIGGIKTLLPMLEEQFTNHTNIDISFLYCFNSY